MGAYQGKTSSYDHGLCKLGQCEATLALRVDMHEIFSGSNACSNRVTPAFRAATPSKTQGSQAAPVPFL